MKTKFVLFTLIFGLITVLHIQDTKTDDWFYADETVLETKSCKGLKGKCSNNDDCCDGLGCKISLFSSSKCLYNNGHKCQENDECFFGNCIDSVCMDMS